MFLDGLGLGEAYLAGAFGFGRGEHNDLFGLAFAQHADAVGFGLRQRAGLIRFLRRAPQIGAAFVLHHSDGQLGLRDRGLLRGADLGFAQLREDALDLHIAFVNR
ncbi:MAG: hypothetical protein ABUS57_07175 [Pseudomonadota bacterium]